MILFLLACDGGAGSDVGTPKFEEYLVVDGSRSWTWRDDGGAESPDAATLLHGQITEANTLELRRGTRWADATMEGFFHWEVGDGLSLMGWEYQGAASSQPALFAEADTKVGETVNANDWSCTLEKPEAVTTYYATYDDTIQFACEGSAGPAGSWSFARSHGLIRLESGGVVMESVAPY